MKTFRFAPAHLPSGVRRFALLALLAAGAHLPPAPAHAQEKGPGPLPWRIGYEVGFCADAAAFPESSGVTVELYVRIRPTLIADLTRGGDTPSPIRLQATLQPLFGRGKSVTRQESFTVQSADTSDALGEVVVMRFPANPGRHRLRIEMETRRQRLARAGMRGPERAKVEGELDIPGPQAGREISDLEFVWGETRRTVPSVFGRGRRGLIPHPERLYGLFANTMRAYFTARGERDRPWLWVARATGADGTLVSEQSGRADPGERMAAEIAMDVSELPAGAYDLEVKAWQEGDAGALLRRSRFSVAWREESWTRDPQVIVDDVHFLLSADDEEAFERLSPGEQERKLDEFWKPRDPTPDTGENEARTRYYQRVRFANLTYGRYGLGRGMFSDMGRAYIRYGEPAEVIRQVMPSLGDNLTRIIYDLARTENRQLGAVGNREIGADTRPFELWIYEGNIPLPIDADPSHSASRISGTRMVFLFVDEHWTGDYRLLYSSE